MSNDESAGILDNSKDNAIDRSDVITACKCRLKCHDKFSDETKKNILHHFVNCKHGERRLFIDSHVERFEKGRRTNTSSNKRQFTHIYKLPLQNGKKEKVCKSMFLNTIGRRSDNCVVSHFKSKANNNGIVCKDDNRGQKINSIRKTTKSQSEENIIGHIETFHPQVCVNTIFCIYESIYKGALFHDKYISSWEFFFVDCFYL